VKGIDPFFRRAIENLIVRVLGLDPEDVDGCVRLREDFAADSADLLELALELEAVLEVEIVDRALKDLTTVDDLIHFRRSEKLAGNEFVVRRAYLRITNEMQEMLDDLASRRRLPIIG
jgi:acyl carrier protein